MRIHITKNPHIENTTAKEQGQGEGKEGVGDRRGMLMAGCVEPCINVL